MHFNNKLFALKVKKLRFGELSLQNVITFKKERIKYVF